MTNETRKIRTTNKELKNSFTVLSCGSWIDTQYIFYGLDPDYCSYDSFRWNWDAYILNCGHITKLAFIIGDRNFPASDLTIRITNNSRHENDIKQAFTINPDFKDVITEYNNRAREIFENLNYSFDEKNFWINSLRREMREELILDRN